MCQNTTLEQIQIQHILSIRSAAMSHERMQYIDYYIEQYEALTHLYGAVPACEMVLGAIRRCSLVDSPEPINPRMTTSDLVTWVGIGIVLASFLIAQLVKGLV